VISIPKVVVIGSLNLDYIAGVERLPAPGQTIAAHSLIRRFGGKGANQAVAAARQGARVSMIGCVGADAEGQAYRRRLRGEGVNVSGLTTARTLLTGTALIAVERTGENIIIVAAGANAQLLPAAIRAQRSLIASANVVLLQFEVPMAAVIEAVLLANSAKVPVIINPSPLRDDFPWGKLKVESLIVNSGEAAAIFKQSLKTIEARLPGWRRALARRKIDNLIITRGADPTICITLSRFLTIPVMRVRPIDTVGAGDAFAGTFAANRARGFNLETAICHANSAGALATLKPGAQEAIPNRAATESAAKRHILGAPASRRRVARLSETRAAGGTPALPRQPALL
jgi:ribokinase